MNQTHFICSPEFYYDCRTRESITNLMNQEANKWIFDIKNSVHEKIVISNKHWTMVRDRYSKNNKRFLIVFEDNTLLTIRDLRLSHVPMLTRIRDTILQQFCHLHARDTLHLYFHYHPSIYLLHLHVHFKEPSRFDGSEQNSRIQNINNVIKNLCANTYHYRDALIWCPIPKTLKCGTLTTFTNISPSCEPGNVSDNTSRSGKRTCSWRTVQLCRHVAPLYQYVLLRFAWIRLYNMLLPVIHIRSFFRIWKGIVKWCQFCHQRVHINVQQLFRYVTKKKRNQTNATTDHKKCYRSRAALICDKY